MVEFQAGTQKSDKQTHTSVFAIRRNWSFMRNFDWKEFKNYKDCSPKKSSFLIVKKVFSGHIEN